MRGVKWMGMVFFFALMMTAILLVFFGRLHLVGIIIVVVALISLALLALSSRVNIAWNESSDAWWVPGLVILAALFVPTAVLVGSDFSSCLVPVLVPVEGLLHTVIFFLPSVAVVVAAFLLRSGIRRGILWRESHAGSGRDSRIGWKALVSLVLSVLLLARTLYNLYWLMAWDTTYDPIESFWLVIPTLAALFSGMMLFVTLPNGVKWVSLYALVVPLMMYIVSTFAWRLDFHQVTDERAAHVVRLLEDYRVRVGRYPQILDQLIPMNALSIPSPFIIYGQAWCYDGGPDYYRLGYVTRDHWSDPCWRAQEVRTAGPLPDLPPFCAGALAAHNNVSQPWCDE